MKKLIKFIFVIAFIFSITNGFSQKNYKFGHINSQELIQLMPERDIASAALQEHTAQLENQLKEMNSEIESKYTVYMQQKDTYTDLIRQTKEKELGDLQERMQNFQMTAQQDIQNKEAELWQPIVDKANKAIDEVGKENGFTYIFDVSTGSVVYFSPESIDVMPLVKAKLGITTTTTTE